MKKVLKDNYIYLCLLILLILIFCFIYASSWYVDILRFDYNIRDLVNSVRNDNLTLIFNVFTFIGDLYIPILIIVCLFFTLKNKLYVYLLTYSYVFTGMIIFITKNLFMRPRPLEAIITIPSSYSFPSGHTLSSIVFYLTLWYLFTLCSKKSYKILTGIIYLLFVFMIGMSRIYLGVHFFSDVLGGFILSIPCLLIIKSVIDKYYLKKLKKVTM